MRAPCRSPIRARVLWISIKIESGAEDRTGRINATAFRTFRFPGECSCGTRRSWRDQRERFRPNDRLPRSPFRFVEKPPGVFFLPLFRCLSKLNRDDIRDEFRDQTHRRNSNADCYHPPCCLRFERVLYVYSLSRSSCTEKRVPIINDRLIISLFVIYSCEKFDFPSNC